MMESTEDEFWHELSPFEGKKWFHTNSVKSTEMSYFQKLEFSFQIYPKFKQGRIQAEKLLDNLQSKIYDTLMLNFLMQFHIVLTCEKTHRIGKKSHL